MLADSGDLGIQIWDELPTFLGLEAPRGLLLFTALALVWAFAMAGSGGLPDSRRTAVPASSGTCCANRSNRLEPSLRPPTTTGVHPRLPFFVFFSYAWLLIAVFISMFAAWSDHSGGIWGAASLSLGSRFHHDDGLCHRAATFFSLRRRTESCTVLA